VVLGDVGLLVVEHRLQRRIVVEHDGWPFVDQELRAHRARLDHAAVGREVAAQHRERSLGIDRPVERPDHVVVVDAGAVDVLADRLPGHRELVEREVRRDPLHQRRQAARVVEVLHQVLAGAARPHVRDHRDDAADAVEVVEADGWFARFAIAITWMIALVEQPIAIATAIALR
jgi:hypothetical protein